MLDDAQPSALAREAFQLMVDSNLPQKYAYFGRLDSSDVMSTDTAFYDCGAVS